MTQNNPVSPHVQATVERIAAMGRPAVEEADALVQVALDLQKQPRDPQELFDALFLYERALSLVGEDAVASARIKAGRGSALRRMPGHGPEDLDRARDDFREALTVLHEAGEPEEVAEIELSLAMVIHGLAGMGRAKLKDAVEGYHRALKTFTREAYPREFAVLHNNLATAYLSMRLAPEKEGLREAMAVQSFREALTVVTLEHDPSEYAMLQNNLGNALQAMRSSHPFENLVRAVEAYDEALKVRTEYDTPVEYANTVANKANALMNLPDELEAPDQGNPKNLAQAVTLLDSAAEVFGRHHVDDRATMVRELAAELKRELAEAATGQVEGGP